MSEAAETPADTSVADQAPPAEADASEQTQANTPRTQIEAAAKSSGWAPKDEWKGDPSDWMDAPDFILKAVGEVLPNMRKSLNELKAENGSMKTTLAKTVASAYERAMADLKAQQAAAVQAGDLDAVDEITDRIADLKTEGKPAPSDPFQAKFEAWKADNAWYESDPDLKAYAYGVGQDLASKGVAPEDQLAEVSKRVRAAFPHKFENPRRREPAVTEGATNNRRSGGKTFSDLPPEARQMCIEFERDIKGFKREQYVRDYFAN